MYQAFSKSKNKLIFGKRLGSWFEVRVDAVEALKHIDVNGKNSGYKINFDKTQYVMCKVTNKEELLRKVHI